jgi:hypothetical protein
VIIEKEKGLLRDIAISGYGTVTKKRTLGI